MALSSTSSIGARNHLVTLQNPGAATPDADGGFTQTWSMLSPPQVYARIQAATQRDLERVTAGTVLSTATHIVTMPYHPQVSTQTRVLVNGRTFSVTGVTNPDERNIDLVLTCTEVVT
jgi:SPP1 family predicted phage head-tail adaptor